MKRFVFSFVLIFILFTSINFADAQSASWHLPGWQYRQQLNLENIKSNSLVFIKLSDSSQIFDYLKNNGEDIRLVDQNGNFLPFAIENWSYQHQKALVVAKLLTETENIYLYAGSPDAVDAQSPNDTYLVFENFVDGSLGNWQPINNPDKIKIQATQWIPTWVEPVPAEDKNIGPSVFLDNGKILATTVFSGEIKQSSDLGKSWQTVSTISPEPEQVCYSRNGYPLEGLFISRFLFKDSQSQLFTSFDTSDKIIRSLDLGQTWQTSLYFEQNNDFAMGRSIADLGNGILLAGQYTGGPCSTDSGTAWDPYAYIFKSTDSGSSWEKVWDNPTLSRHTHLVTADLYHSGRAYASLGEDGTGANPGSNGRVLRSNDYGDNWHTIKQPGPDDPQSNPQGQYWGPTSVTFEPDCRYFGGDNEWDPVIHQSCEENESNFQVSYRIRQQNGYYYWGQNDQQGNNYFGFLSNPCLDEEKTNQRYSLILAKAVGSNFWQVPAFFGPYNQCPLSADYSGWRAGCLAASNFYQGKSLLGVIGEKPSLLYTEENKNKKYLISEPDSEIYLPLSSLSGLDWLLLEFDMAMTSSIPVNHADQMPISGSLYLANELDQKMAGLRMNSDWFIWALDAESPDSSSSTGISFSLDTWYRVQFFINLAAKQWQVCLPEYHYCHPYQALNYPDSLPTKLILRSAGTVSKIVSDIKLATYQPETNQVSLIEESVYQSKPGDVNGDGVVDEIDYAAVITYFGQSGAPGTVIGDVYPLDGGDGVVDEWDYATIINFFGT